MSLLPVYNSSQSVANMDDVPTMPLHMMLDLFPEIYDPTKVFEDEYVDLRSVLDSACQPSHNETDVMKVEEEESTGANETVPMINC